MQTIELGYIKKVMGGKADTWLRTPFFKVRAVTEKRSTRTEEFRATSLLCARLVLSPKAVKKLAWGTKGQALIEKEGRAGPGAGAAGTALNSVLGSVRCGCSHQLPQGNSKDFKYQTTIGENKTNKENIILRLSKQNVPEGLARLTGSSCAPARSVPAVCRVKLALWAGACTPFAPTHTRRQDKASG